MGSDWKHDLIKLLIIKELICNISGLSMSNDMKEGKNFIHISSEEQTFYIYVAFPYLSPNIVLL